MPPRHGSWFCRCRRYPGIHLPLLPACLKRLTSYTSRTSILSCRFGRCAGRCAVITTIEQLLDDQQLTLSRCAVHQFHQYA